MIRSAALVRCRRRVRDPSPQSDVLTTVKRETEMQRLMVLYPPQPDMDAFKAYYANKHIPLVANLPGLLSSRYSFDVQTIAGSTYVCIFEAEFADAPSMGAAMQSPAGQALDQDVPNFAQVAPTLLTYSV